jgi:ADP-heptose:LPS heptosyltransferase
VELLTDGIYYNEYIKLHKTDMRISLLNRFLNLPYPKKQYYLEMFPGKEDLYHAKKLIKYNSSNRYIFIQPGASQMRKRWNPDNFRSIVSWLSNKGFICIFAGRKSEKELIYKITNNCANIILIGDENSMQRLSCIINLCDFIISNDTGPMHIAEAMNKPIFAFFADSHLDHAKPITSNFTKLYTCKMSEQYMDNPLPEIVIKDIEKYIFSLKK